MMNTEEFEVLDIELEKQIRQQYVSNTIRAIKELVKIIMNLSDYGLNKVGERNLEFRIMQMHNQLSL